jgi:uncharacterized membrane-anchored protein YhcB (DUF1043 family)
MKTTLEILIIALLLAPSLSKAMTCSEFKQLAERYQRVHQHIDTDVSSLPTLTDNDMLRDMTTQSKWQPHYSDDNRNADTVRRFANEWYGVCVNNVYGMGWK